MKRNVHEGQVLASKMKKKVDKQVLYQDDKTHLNRDRVETDSQR
jgi:hypothetical protein